MYLAISKKLIHDHVRRSRESDVSMWRKLAHVFLRLFTIVITSITFRVRDQFI